MRIQQDGDTLFVCGIKELDAASARLFDSEPVVQSAPGQGTTIRVMLKVKEDHGRRDPDPDRG